MEIVVNGKSVDEYLHEGKIYIEGKEKSEFSIRVKNNGSSRILAVPTADGLSVMDGKAAGRGSRGYIVDGYDSLVIDGWRTSDNSVAKFFFTSPEKSYAELSDKGENIGVIGVAVFEEKPNTVIIQQYCDYEKVYPVYPFKKPWRPYPDYPYPYNPWWGGGVYTGGSVSPAVMLSSVSADTGSLKSDNAKNMQAIGAGFGDEKNAPVTTVSFDRKDAPSAVFEIFYNTREQLKNMGVIFNKPVYVTPSAFPADNGYCKPPKNN